MHRSLIALALLLLAPLASAQIYTWTDAGGTVHYAQAPPPEGTKYKEVKTSGSLQPQAAPAPVVAADSSGSSGSSSEGSAEPPKPVTDTPENRSKLCTSLKSNLAALNGSAPVVMQVNGKTTALDDSQRKQQATTAQSQYQQYCQSQ